ncbi:hypothetical protein AB0M43_06920 [Longispora sp. NPDC051575]|uniref:hypothetical protein n=1 Tax=Longispora sp. NPDC051575 TaxID=3154943 RepID=UPI00343A5D3F
MVRLKHWWVALVVAAVVLLSPMPAHASAADYGTNPYLAPNYCSQNSSWIARRSVETELGQIVAWANVYFSSRCQTNWVTVDGNPTGGDSYKVIWTDGNRSLEATDRTTLWTYTMQVYAPGSTCVNFHVRLRYPDGRHFAETYTAGANHQRVC